MKKIPTIFIRDYSNLARILPLPHEICEWVFNGEGVATRKYDGTCCLIKGGRLFKRRTIQASNLLPRDFVTAHYDELNNKLIGWVPVDIDDVYHTEALINVTKSYSYHVQEADHPIPDGTYELIGPRINGNPENIRAHVMVSHGFETFSDAPRTFDGLHAWLALRDIEGLVWHHPDGRMAKIKKRDFGLPRKPEKA